jgi:hypothetical protein
MDGTTLFTMSTHEIGHALKKPLMASGPIMSPYQGDAKLEVHSVPKTYRRFR